jgi:predicted Zn finger-like uncharacterized protein
MDAMTVYCSYCSAGYLLPDHLMGPRGARVRCPQCGKTFVVLRDPAVGGGADHAPPRTEVVAPAAPATPVAEPAGDAPAERLACELLDAIAAGGGERLANARERGRVLAEFGPELMRAYDEYRSRLGGDASVHAFRSVLRERWAVDLITGVEP